MACNVACAKQYTHSRCDILIGQLTLLPKGCVIRGDNAESKVFTRHRHTRVDVQSYCRRNVWPSDTETLKIIDNNPLDHCRITTVWCIAVGHLGSNMYVNHDSVASAQSSQFKSALVVLEKTARWQSRTNSIRVRMCKLNQTKQIITTVERSVTVRMKVGIILVRKEGIKTDK